MKAKYEMVVNIIREVFIIIVLLLLAGQVSAYSPKYTPEQQTLLEGMSFSTRLCIAHEKAIQGQNVTEFNTLVDIYNAWIRQHFGEGADALLMSKIASTNLFGIAQEQQVMPKGYTIAGTINPYVTTNPFNASSNLSQFGKQQVRTDLLGGTAYLEEASVQQKLANF
jgi:hypothetical protein